MTSHWETFYYPIRTSRFPFCDRFGIGKLCFCCCFQTKFWFFRQKVASLARKIYHEQRTRCNFYGPKKSQELYIFRGRAHKKTGPCSSPITFMPLYLDKKKRSLHIKTFYGPNAISKDIYWSLLSFFLFLKISFLSVKKTIFCEFSYVFYRIYIATIGSF